MIKKEAKGPRPLWSRPGKGTVAGESSLRRTMVEVGMRAYGSGLVTEIEGNISARLRGDLVLVTPNHVPYEKRTPGDMVLMDSEGRALRGTRKPTTELRMHLAVYRARPDVGAVIHAHPVYSSALAVAREPIPPILDEVVPYAGGTVEVAPFAPPGSQELADSAVRALGTRAAVLLANHGTLCVGRDLNRAFQMTKYVEKWAEITILSRLLGNLTTIPKDRQKEQASMHETIKNLDW